MVTIGNLTSGHLSVAIRARIYLEENVKPGKEEFIERISMGQPICSSCQEPLDFLRDHWMNDCQQIGYKCSKCSRVILKTENALFSEVIGEVRRNYKRYWHKYQQMMLDLTNGKPHKYEVP